MSGLQLEHLHLNCFEHFSVGPDSVLPAIRRRSISCVCSKVSFLCGLVSLTTGFTGWVDRSRFSVISVIRIVWVDIVGNLIVGVRVYLTSVIVVVVIAGTIPVVFGLVFLSFGLTSLVSVVSWFFQWWHTGLRFSGLCCVACCVTVFICSSSGDFQPFSSNSFSSCDTIIWYVPISKCAWLIGFFKWGSILAYMIYSLIAWATTPNECIIR